MQTSEVFYKAADHIQVFGHHKGSGFADPVAWETSAACTIGAISAATHGSLDQAALKAFRAHIGSSFIGEWNDASGRTAAEVIEVLRAAALLEQAKENTSTAVTELVTA